MRWAPVLAVALLVSGCRGGEADVPSGMNTTTATVAAAIDPSPLGSSVPATTTSSPATTAAQPTTTAHVTTTVPPVRGPFVVAHYLDIPRSSSCLEVVPQRNSARSSQSCSMASVIWNRTVRAGWSMASSTIQSCGIGRRGPPEPRPVGEIPGDAIGAWWGLGFIDDEPVLLVVSDNWRESGFGWCDGDAQPRRRANTQMGSGDRIVSLMRVSDGQVVDAHRESFVIGLSGAPNQLTHSFVSGGDTVAFVNDSSIRRQPRSPRRSKPRWSAHRSSSERSATNSSRYRRIHTAVRAPAWPDVNLVGLDRQGRVMVYEESKSGVRQVVAVNLDDGTELLRLQAWRLPDEPVGAFWVDFDPTGIVTVLWADTESDDMYTEVIDLHGGRTTLPWPPAGHPRGAPSVSYLPATRRRPHSNRRPRSSTRYMRSNVSQSAIRWVG